MNQTGKRLLLGVLLVLPVAMYLGSLVISGAVNFRTLEDLGKPIFTKNTDSDTIYGLMKMVVMEKMDSQLKI